MDNTSYSYINAGFDPFFSRSIDSNGSLNLDQTVALQATNREINYDQSQTTGSLGSITRVGNIQLDGVAGRISIYDDNGNEVVRLGAL